MLTSTGLDPKRLADVRADLEEAWRSEFGQGIDLSPDTPDGKIIGIMAERLASLWEQVEGVYQSQYPAGASGTSLDRIGEITNIFRSPATSSTATLYVRGENATIPTGSLVAHVTNGDQFQTTEEFVIPAAHELSNLTGTGSVTRSGTTATVSYTSHGFNVGEFIWITGLDQDEYNGVHEVATVPDANTLTFEIVGTPASPATGGGTAYEAYPVSAESVSTGSIQALAGTLTEITTPVSGWDAVTNRNDATEGRNEETDAEFRTRRLAALAGLGNATIEAIRGAVLAVENVTLVKVFENDQDVEVSGRPPHSFEVLVKGGDTGDIAQAIWDNKGAGIQTYGTSSDTATDTEGEAQTVNFSRPSDVDIYLDLTLTVNSDYPADGDALVEEAVLEWASDLGIGEDVVVFPYLVGSIIAIDGITDVAVDIGKTAGPSGDANIAIGETEIAVFDSARITVTS